MRVHFINYASTAQMEAKILAFTQVPRGMALE